MFRCKKCGSEKYKLVEKGTATGLHCADCGFWHKWVGKGDLYKYKAFLAKKALSTAEKLYELVRKGLNITRTSNGQILFDYKDDLRKTDLSDMQSVIDELYEKSKERKNG